MLLAELCYTARDYFTKGQRVQYLESLYEKPPLFHHFHDRKTRIEHPNTLVIGPKGAGKTALMLDYLATCPAGSYLYFDFEDLRIPKATLAKDLAAFATAHSLSLVAIDNYDPALALESKTDLLLSSSDHTLHVNTLTPLYVNALDFEEFIAFRKGAFSPEHLFNLYANHGRQPSVASVHDGELAHALQTHIRGALQDTTQLVLFQFLATHQARPLSLRQAYQHLKTRMKLSKDTLYRTTAWLERQGLMHFIPKHNSPKTPKKIYLNDFAFKHALTFERDFLRRFENIVFCELLAKRTPLFYTDNLDFYLPETSEGIVCIPFLPAELILRRFQGMLSHLKALGITSLTVLSVGNEGAGEKEGVACEILPFWEWALRN
jgi:predicted AAA+ superfamily ATPase